MNRSAKDGIRSSPHCWGEGVTHAPHRTRVFAGGTIREIHAWPQETCRCPGDQLTMETKLEQIAVKAVNQLPKSVVREIRTPRSVGPGGAGARRRRPGGRSATPL